MSTIPTIAASDRVQVGQPAAGTTWVRGLVESLKSAVRYGRHPAARPSVMDSRPRLGDAVRHGRYGFGVVTARWPDGRLQIRFDRVARNRLIWPTHVTRLDGVGR